MKFSNDHHEEPNLLPWYVNGSLSRDEQAAMDRWLEASPDAVQDLAEWNLIQKAVKNQPKRHLPPQAWEELQQRIQVEAGRRQERSLFLWGGAVLTLLVLALLWIAIRPGVVLQWSTQQDSVSGFRVYRAPFGTREFDLVSVIPASQETGLYQYSDPYLLPGQKYVYRVEGVPANGEATMSETIVSSSNSALPGQLAVLLTSLMIGYSLILLVETFVKQPVLKHTGALT